MDVVLAVRQAREIKKALSEVDVSLYDERIAALALLADSLAETVLADPYGDAHGGYDG